jgi:hypothetical protein
MVIGQNKGFSNEDIIRNKINNSKFSELESNIQTILNFINSNIKSNGNLKAYKKEGKGLAKKTDLFVTLDDMEFCRLSVKSGDGNSVHQENIYQFTKFLESLGVREELIQDLLYFHWGDGTYDGSGKETDRRNAVYLKKEYPEKIESIQKIFTSVRKEIIERALIGEKNGTEPNYVIYFEDKNLKDLQIMSMSKVINHHVSIKNMHNDLKIGNLTFQNYQRCLKGQEKNSNKNRNDIQFKWSGIAEDLKKIIHDK